VTRSRPILPRPLHRRKRRGDMLEVGGMNLYGPLTVSLRSRHLADSGSFNHGRHDDAVDKTDEHIPHQVVISLLAKPGHSVRWGHMLSPDRSHVLCRRQMDQSRRSEDNIEPCCRQMNAMSASTLRMASELQ
jgi:hypothetical protein